MRAEDSTGGAGGGTFGSGGTNTSSGGGNTDAAIKAAIQGGAAAVNMPGLFQNDPYNQYGVYLGGGQYMGSTFTRTQTPYAQAVLAPTTWDEKQLREFVNKGIINKVPGFEVGMGMPQIQAAWQNMVQSSILFNQGGTRPGGTPWTPYDVMDTWANSKGKYGTKRQGDWIFDVATGERIKYVGKTSRTTTSKQVNLSSPEEAQALVTQALREALGRAPNAKELAKFKASISGYEHAHPQVTTTTQQLSPDLATGEVSVTSESSTTTGGVSDAARAALVTAPTEKTKEYGKYQSATTYWDAMMQMLGGSA